MAYWVWLGAGCLALAACANNNVASHSGTDNRVAAKAPATERVAVQRTQRPDAAGPRAAHAGVHYSTVGTASWYGADFHGRRTANGETYDMHSLTAAHPTLPLHSTVRVTNLTNHRSLVLRVNDRGPFVDNRVIDVSAQSAKLLGFYDRGLAKVKVEVVGNAPQKNADANSPAAVAQENAK